MQKGSLCRHDRLNLTLNLILNLILKKNYIGRVLMTYTDKTARRRQPAYLQFYPTLKCNYSCNFCFNRELSGADDASVEDFNKMVSVCKAQGIRHIDILGGEPTLHPDLFDMLDIIVRSSMMTTISSNGSRVEALLKISERYPRDSVRLGISVNSAKIPESLHQYILVHRPILKTVFAKQDLIPESLTPYIGLQGVDFYLLYRDVLNPDDLAYSIGFKDFYTRLCNIRKAYDGVDGVFCAGFIPDKEAFPELEYVRCPAGTTKLSVMPDGSVYPCYLLFKYKEFELGNIFHDDFNAIWDHPILNEFRIFYQNQCPETACQLHDECHGGCPAISYMFFKHLKAPDPRCVNIANGV
mgnify:CR=1 FL=1